jgi:hypothetical protein
MLTTSLRRLPTEAPKEQCDSAKAQDHQLHEHGKVVENLIKNKGFADALVLMTTIRSMSCKQTGNHQSDVAKICDIVMRETGRNASQIVIQSKY